MKAILLIATAAVLLAGCGPTRDVKLTVVNEAASKLTNIVASGAGFSAPVGSLAPGAQVTVTNPRPSGDAGFELAYDADGKHFSEKTRNDPWDGMKEIVMTVTTNFNVTYESVTTF